mgnify:CR=1 FL=1
MDQLLLTPTPPPLHTPSMLATPQRPPSRPPYLTQFKPGQSGNPNGLVPRSASISQIVRNLTHDGIDALDVIIHIMQTSKRETVRLSAANALLDRGWGKPVAAVELSGPGGGPLEMASNAFAGMSTDDLRLLVAQREVLIAQRERLLTLIEAGQTPEGTATAPVPLFDPTAEATRESEATEPVAAIAGVDITGTVRSSDVAEETPLPDQGGATRVTPVEPSGSFSPKVDLSEEVAHDGNRNGIGHIDFRSGGKQPSHHAAGATGIAAYARSRWPRGVSPIAVGGDNRCWACGVGIPKQVRYCGHGCGERHCVECKKRHRCWATKEGKRRVERQKTARAKVAAC